MTKLRNIAIIAHVDHGKTTLVDNMLKQSGTFRENQAVAERAMDSNDQERERGITILAKCTSVVWNNIRINIVDTPGHADFGGEVERILSMVDGVVLLVDASEGPMPQTKFVLSKALELNLKPIVVINKVDRPDERITEVVDEIFELFMALNASNEQIDFPIIYASGRNGWAARSLEDPRENLSPLFDKIIEHVEEPKADANAPFSMLVTTREYNSYLGRILTGRVYSGEVKVNQSIKVLNREGKLVANGRVSKILAFRGLERTPIELAKAGDIVAIAGIAEASVSDTLCDAEIETPIDSLPIDPPTLAMTFAINNSPLAGKEGTKLTSRVIGDRLSNEMEGNVAIRVTETSDKEAFEVAGRGELQLGVFIETLRRDGFELSISRPRVLFQKDENGQKMEPMERIQVDVDDDFVGVVVESLSQRKCEMTDMKPSGGGKTRISFKGPSRGLIGYHGQFLTETRGTGIMNRVFDSYGPFARGIEGRRNGVIIANSSGEASAYALWNLQERGKLFINPGDKVYEGMVIGQNSKDNDLEVNPLKAKQLTNVRASGKDEAISLVPPVMMTLEQTISYIDDDELVEVTPTSIRIRKKHLNAVDRKRAQKST